MEIQSLRQVLAVPRIGNFAVSMCGYPLPGVASADRGTCGGHPGRPAVAPYVGDGIKGRLRFAASGTSGSAGHGNLPRIHPGGCGRQTPRAGPDDFRCWVEHSHRGPAEVRGSGREWGEYSAERCGRVGHGLGLPPAPRAQPPPRGIQLLTENPPSAHLCVVSTIGRLNSLRMRSPACNVHRFPPDDRELVPMARRDCLI